MTDLGRDDLRPARYTVDVFRPAAMQPSTVRTTVVREGRRLCLVDAVLEQDGEAVARASGLFLKISDPVAGEVWEPTESPEVPPLDLAPVSDEPQVPLFASEGDHQHGRELGQQRRGVHQHRHHPAPGAAASGPPDRSVRRRPGQPGRDRGRDRHRVRPGGLGTTVVSAIANSRRTVDFEVHDFKDDPRVGGA